MATKRTMQDENSEATKKARVDGAADLQELRVLIDNYEASVIIGKGGANVKKIRVDSSAFVSILKSEGAAKERVMQVKGTVEYNVTALRLIAELLLNNDNERKAAENPEAAGDSWTFKILIHKSLAGAIIGRGGEIVRAMQTETGARVSLSTDVVGASTEKTVTVSGNLDQLQEVLTRILTQLRENPVRPGTSSIPYVPGVVAQQFPSPYAAAPFGMAQPYGMPPPQYGMAPQMAAPGMGGPTKTEKIVIPTVCAGTVIGKQGSIIREIKNQSGTVISVAAAEPTSPNDRVVSISGTPQGIQLAIHLIRQRVESYQPPPGTTPVY
jgi:predicted RNA-binding protein YlqC (UPF0109 family)